MKTYPVRLEEIASWESLRDAWRSYRSGKRRRPDVAEFEINADRRLLALSRSLLDGRYRHGSYQLKHIVDPKPRLIAVANVRDRVVHAALYGALGPLYESRYIMDTFACLKGRGTHRAILRFQGLQRRYPYFVPLDIRQYFPSIAHEILDNLVVRHLREERIHELIRNLLATGRRLYQRADVRAFYRISDSAVPRGLPIGNLTSQWWGNLYLDGLDHFVKRNLKVPGYLRYLDDFVLFGDRRRDLRRWSDDIQCWLKSNRALTLKSSQCSVLETRWPYEFLGYVISPSSIRPGAASLKRFKNACSRLAGSSTAQCMDTLVGRRESLLPFQ
jgi:retron-type reverse transcriptase